MDFKVIYSSLLSHRGGEAEDQLRLSGEGNRTKAEVAKKMDQMATGVSQSQTAEVADEV